MQAFRRTVAAVSALCVLGTSMPTVALAAPADAPALITTEEAIAPGVQQRLSGLLARDDVRAGLLARGVDPAQVDARVAALTEDEARALADRLDQLPAGGEVLGVLFAIFIILLVTDILGLTKVFPFTRPVR